ncbi:MAG: heavy-metal-associated domain-containing protein [Actinomycetota bacterium]|jgi:hypothetical protein|nr:heavy-metal-associated domain-containing protein [Actinomycetota bacterium]
MTAVIDALSGVSAVQTSPLTGSVVVHYDPGGTGVDDLRTAFEGLGLTLMEAESAERAQGSPARRVLDAADGVNYRVGRRFGGSDLRLLFPLALGALSFRQATRDAPGLDQAPWYLLAWYAFDSFLKLNDRDTDGFTRHLPHTGEIRNS